MTRTPVVSAAIRSIGHEGNVLEVEMANGSLYHVTGFTPEDHAAFLAAPSLGRHFSTHIKQGGFAITKVAHDPHA